MTDRDCNLDDLETDAWNLYHQLDAVVDMMQEAQHDRPHPRAITTQDRVDGMAWIARDLAEKIAQCTGQILSADKLERSTEVDVIRTLGEEYEEALEAWNAAGKAADALDASEELKTAEVKAEARHDMYRDALFNFKSQHAAAMAEKATILLRVWNNADGMSDERIVQLLQSMGGRA